jgi:hypothetical protein
MKFSIIVLALLSCSALAGKSGKQIKALQAEIGAIKDELKTMGETQESRHAALLEKIEALQGELSKVGAGQDKLNELVASKCDKENSGTWYLGMNINPADGHIFGYTVGWATGVDIGSADEALTKDYLSANVWVKPANYIAIVRHQQGVVDAVKVFKFKTSAESLLTRFGLPNMNPGRQIVTSGGPIQESVADTAENLGDDPIFSVGGDLAFNWAYTDNGCRIALTGGHLSEVNANDDNTHGLGNNYACNPLTNTPNGADWPHDISNIQDCPLQSCREVRLQGTDHGPGHHLKSGPVYGNYAIYVSWDAESFPQPGATLSAEIGL